MGGVRLIIITTLYLSLVLEVLDASKAFKTAVDHDGQPSAESLTLFHTDSVYVCVCMQGKQFISWWFTSSLQAGRTVYKQDEWFINWLNSWQAGRTVYKQAYRQYMSPSLM